MNCSFAVTDDYIYIFIIESYRKYRKKQEKKEKKVKLG